MSVLYAVKGLAWGLWYGYPPCCVIRFCADRLATGSRWSAVERGSVRGRRDGKVWVPCGILHRAAPYELERIRAAHWNLV